MSKEHIIASIGQRLLQGQRMLAECCKDCNAPLMEHKGLIECAGCLKRFERNEDNEVVAVAAVEAPKVTPVESRAAEKNSSSTTVSASQSGSRRDVAAAALPKSASGEVNLVSLRLLEGWTMLEHHCPVCYAPIMKNPTDDSMWCVNCNVQALTEDKFDALKHRKVEKREDLSNRERTANDLNDNNNNNNNNSDALNTRTTAPSSSIQQRSEKANASSSSSSTKLHGATSNVESAFETASRALCSRLILISNKLAECQAEEIHEAEQLMEHMVRISDAIKHF